MAARVLVRRARVRDRWGEGSARRSRHQADDEREG
jgi:hypothetical protein